MTTSTPAIIQNRFNSQGAISSASPGDFDSISGSGSQRKVPVGARLTSDTHPFGWSCYGEQLLGEYDTSAYDFATTSYMLQGWFYLEEANTNNDLQLMHFEYGGNSRQYLIRHTDGRTRFQIADTTYTTILAAGEFPVGKWMWFGVVFCKGHSNLNRLKFSVYHKTIGEDMVQLLDSATIGYVGAALPFTKAVIGYYELGGSVTNKGRLAMPGIYATGGWYEQDLATYPTDIAEPYVGDTNIHVDPYWGSDANAGTTSDVPIKSITTAATVASAMPTKTGAYADFDHRFVVNTYYGTAYANGVTGYVNLSNTTGLLVTPPDFIETTRTTPWRTARVDSVIPSATFAKLEMETTIPSDDMSLTTDQTYTYEYSFTESHDMERATIDEDDAPMEALDSIASVEANPGSYYNDGDTIYFHASDSSDPTTNGKTYKYSGIFSDGSVPDPGFRVGKDTTFQGFLVGGTKDYSKEHGNTNGSYPVSTGTINVGTLTITDSHFYKTSKHGPSSVTASPCTIIFRRCSFEQQVAYVGPGSATPLVFFANDSAGEDIQTILIDQCWCDTLFAKVGTSEGDPDKVGNAILSHSEGTNPRFIASFTVQNSDFQNGGISLSNLNELTITNTRFWGGNCYPVTGWIENVEVVGSMFSATKSTIASMVFHSNSFASWGNSSGHYISGSCKHLLCTFDFRTGVVLGGATNNADTRLFQMEGTVSSFTVYGCVFLFNTTRHPVLYKFTTSQLASTDIDYNVYECDEDAGFAYVDGVIKTFAQWQALGMDANSVRVDPGTMTMTAGTWAPEAGDIVRNMVPAHGSLTMPTESFGGGDRLSGTNYDAGAVEYIPQSSGGYTQLITIGEGESVLVEVG